MELALSLGEAPPAKPFSFLPEKADIDSNKVVGLELGFCMGLGRREEGDDADAEAEEERRARERASSSDPLLQLELLPFSPVPRIHHHHNNSGGSPPPAVRQLEYSWPPPEQGNSEVSNRGGGGGGGLDVNMVPSSMEDMDEGAQPVSSSSPNSDVSSFQMEFGSPAYRAGRGGDGGGGRAEVERASSWASDEEENGLTRKKLRLSKEQSAYLEESFKEHNTLNPKQKVALAKQLNLRPRQVEVWFQNRRARTKLKQTEVDCEYLKRCCEKLTEENRRLQKELQELRALKTSHPFYMHLPATTLTMCPSCERVATTNPSTSTAIATTATSPPDAATPAADHATTAAAAIGAGAPSGFPLRPQFYPFVPQIHSNQQQQQLAAAQHQPSAAS